MSTAFANTIRRIDRIEQIITALPPYQLYFSAERYDWVNQEYLTPKMTGVREYFSSRNQLARELDVLTLNLRQKRSDLEDFVRTVVFLVRGYANLHPSDGLNEVISNQNHQIDQKSVLLLEKIDDLILKSNSPYGLTDFGVVKSELELKLNDYSSEKTQYDQLKTKMETEKQEFLQKEDEVDDLYHDLINAVEAALHEDRDILLKIMPWRKQSTAKEAQITLTNLSPAEVVTNTETAITLTFDQNITILNWDGSASEIGAVMGVNVTAGSGAVKLESASGNVTVIRVTATSAGEFSFEVKVQDAKGAEGSVEVYLTVNSQ
jgi:hypothetical protein